MPFSCAICNFITNSASVYKEHLQSVEHLDNAKKPKQVQPPPNNNSSLPPSQTLTKTLGFTNHPTSHQPPHQQVPSLGYAAQVYQYNNSTHPSINSKPVERSIPVPANNDVGFIPHSKKIETNVDNGTYIHSGNVNTIPGSFLNYRGQQFVSTGVPNHIQFNDVNETNVDSGNSAIRNDRNFNTNTTHYTNVKSNTNTNPYYPYQTNTVTYPTRTSPHSNQSSNSSGTSNPDFHPYQEFDNNFKTPSSIPTYPLFNQRNLPTQQPNYQHPVYYQENRTTSASSFAFSEDEDLNHAFGNLNLTSSSATQHLNNWTCNICQSVCNSKEKYEEHVRGSKHQKKLRTIQQESAFSVYGSATQEEKPRISPPQSHQQIPSVQPQAYQPRISQPPQSQIPEIFRKHSQYFTKTIVGSMECYSCTLCNVDCNGPDVLLTHFNGKQHLKNVNREQLNYQFTIQPNYNPIPQYHTPPNTSNTSSSPKNTYQNEFPKPTSPPMENDVEQPSIGQLIKEGVVQVQKIGKQDGYTCSCCEMFCNSIDALQDHVRGRKHIKSYASYLAKNLIAQSTPSTFVPIKPINQNVESEFDDSRSVQILEYFWSQTFGANNKPTYKETSYGPSHDTRFHCEIDLSPLRLESEEGNGKTKKDAKKDACTNSCRALDRMGALKKAVPPYLYYPAKK